MDSPDEVILSISMNSNASDKWPLPILLIRDSEHSYEYDLFKCGMPVYINPPERNYEEIRTALLPSEIANPLDIPSAELVRVIESCTPWMGYIHTGEKVYLSEGIQKLFQDNK